MRSSSRTSALLLRRLAAWSAALGVVAASALVASPAAAAEVDLVVNVSSDRGSYTADEVAVHTVRVDNRGTAATSAATVLTLTVPNVANGTYAWENDIVCTPTNGAVCPTSYTRANTTATATIPSIPVAGSLTFTARVPGNPTNEIRGSVAITAAVSSAAGDTELEPSTNTSSVNVMISSPEAEYSIDAAGPGTASVGTPVTYDVVLRNDGVRNSIYAETMLSGAAGSATPTLTPFPGLRFTGVQCLDATGGALCSNVRTVSAGVEEITQPNPPVASGLVAGHGVLDMPPGSSITLRYTVDLGTPACNAASSGAERLLTLNTIVDYISARGSVEPDELTGDNTAAVLTNIPVPPCSTGDVATVSVTQPQGQLTNGVAIGGAFEYTAQFSNLSGQTATDAPIAFTPSWPGGPGVTASTSPTCAPSGGATCPTAWEWDGATLRGSGAVFPAGGSLSITFTGTGGTDNTTVCRPRSMTAGFQVRPPFGFVDTNWLPNQTFAQGQGNNARQVSTTTAVGSPCTDSHDDSAQNAGPFTDPAATIPLVGPLTPGQVVYFRSTFTNQLPSPDYAVWSISQQAQLPSTGLVLDTSDPDRFFRHQGSDPAGIPFRDDYEIGGQIVVPFDTGVRCTASGGAVCPTEISSSSGTGGAGQFWSNAWQAYWKTGTRPIMPAGSSYSMISSYKVPDLAPRYRLGECVPNGVNFGSGTGAATRTTIDVPFRTEIAAATDPATFDRNTANDATVVTLPLTIKRCDNTLAVTKTALTPQMPVDRAVKYRIVASNTSAQPLDLPRIIDSLSVDAPATIECVGTTLNAVCPTFAPTKDVRHFADGSTGPITYRTSSVSPLASFDFAWGTPGQPTMPPGSTVTFEVTVQYPATFTGNVANIVNFAGDPAAGGGSWAPVLASAAVTSPSGSKLSLAKTVTPVAPRPGSVVTFTVDVVNTGATLPQAQFSDTMHPLFSPTNPTGYGNITCRPLTAADDVLRSGVAVGAATCPSFTSTATGISAVITDFQNNSGVRITYTAVAPLTAGSLPNIAVLTQSGTQVSTGDASSQANILVMTATVSGTVWDDADGSAAGTFEGIDNDGENPTDAGGLNAVLIDADTGEVIAVVPVNADGTYEFASAPVLVDVSVAITAESPTVGSVFTSPVLPAGWIGTSPLQQDVFNTGVAETVEKDFGIEQPPSTDDKTDPLTPNPGGDVRVQVPTLTGSDPEDGAVGTGDAFQIVTLPANGTLYYDGVPVTAGQIISDYDPAKLTVDPAPGVVTVVFTVAAVDAAGVPDPTPATVTMPFSVADAASISGSVWFDADKNGIRDPGEVGIAGVTVTLRGVDEAGNAIERETVTDSAGNWSFPNLPPGRYSVREAQPSGYLDGDDRLGTGAAEQGSIDGDGFIDIVLVGGQAAIGYDFGEIIDDTVPAAPVDPVAPVAIAGLASTGLSGVLGTALLAGLLVVGGLLLLRRRRAA